LFSRNKDKTKSQEPAEVKSPKVPKKSKMSGKARMSLDIGSKTTKLVTGILKGNSVNISSVNGTINKSEACFDGKMLDIHEVESTIKRLISSSSVHTKSAVCTIESTEIIRREMDISDVSEGDLEGLVSYEISQYLPIDTANYLLQIRKLGSYQEDKINKIKIAVGAMPKGIAESYQKLYSALGLDQSALDINSNALEKLIKLEKKADSRSVFNNRNVAFIDMGHSFFNISIFGNGDYLFSKLLPIGGSMVDSVISDVYRIGLNEAETVKIRKSDNYSINDMLTKFSQQKTSS